MELPSRQTIGNHPDTKLGSWQLASLATSVFSFGAQLVRGFLVTWILTPAEYGLLGIVTSVGATIGIMQHLGIQSGVVKEVSIAEAPESVSHTLSVAFTIRLLISVPLALGMFLGAPYLAYQVYKAPEIVLPLRLFATLLIFQGIEEICIATFSGLQRFRIVFSSQAFKALLQIVLYVLLTSLYRLDGYFSAQLSVAVVTAMGLACAALWTLGFRLRLPPRPQFKRVFKTLFSFALILYAAKVLYTIWTRFGILILGLYVSNEEVGYFNFALLFASQMLLIGNAVSRVNMPIMSRRFVNDRVAFARTFDRNFDRVWTLTFFGVAILIYFAPGVLTLIFGNKYAGAYESLPFVCTAYALHTLLNVVCSSVIVTSSNERHLALGELILNLVTIPVLYIVVSTSHNIRGAAAAMLLGEMAFFAYIAWITCRKLQIRLITKSRLIAILILTPLVVLPQFISNWITRFSVFTPVVGVYLAFLINRKIFTVEDISRLNPFSPKKGAHGGTLP
jgi:stage V sporulation protein B